jgi:hypothetical protein
MRKSVLVVLFIIGLMMAPILIHAEVYKWVDEKGTVHFTEDNSTIPEKYGQQVEKIYLPEGPKPTTEGEKTEGKRAGTLLPSPGAQEMLLLFSGLISRVEGGLIAVTQGGLEMVFTVLEDTTIKTDQGQNLSFNQLQNGSSVTIEYIKKGEENQARSITMIPVQAGNPNLAPSQKDDWQGKQSGKDIQDGDWKGKQSAQDIQKPLWQKNITKPPAPKK